MTSSALKSKTSKKSMRTNAKPSTTSLRCRRLYIARPDVLHQYLRHHCINQYLEYVEQRFPTFVKVFTLGATYEGRPLKAIEIDWCCERNMREEAKKLPSQRFKSAPPSSNRNGYNSGGKNRKRRNMIFIEGGTHAREWLTISVALNCIYQLTEKHIRNQSIMERFRFFIVPITNPDGYEYTMEKNHRWRKNRRPTSPSCTHFGIDCNRNYDFHWDKGTNKASRNTYKGEKPFSESETQALSSTLLNLGPDILLFISLHSYAQSIMYPWGYTRDPPENMSELQAVASAGSFAIRAYSGRCYRTGTISKLSTHIIGGSIVDYAYGVIKIPFAFVMELPDSSYGFQPPPEVIHPVGQESWIGIKEMCHCANTLYNTRPPQVSVSQEMRKKYGKPIALAKQILYGTEAYKRIHTVA